MGVLNTIELEGVSTDGWSAAAREALREATKTIRHVRKMDIIETSCRVRENDIVEFRTSVRLFFEVEPSH